MKNQSLPVLARGGDVSSPLASRGGDVSSPSVPESRVLAACQAAARAEADYATKAVIAGLLLLEHRQALCSCHSGTGKTNDVIRHNQHTSSDKNFTLWIERNGIAKRTAYRWMGAAECVARLQLGLQTAEPLLPYIDVEGVSVPLSQALTAPEAELPPKAMAFRQGVFDFMSDKTLAEAMTAALDGESPAHRITRAAAGKLHGGTRGEDRKAWHTFVAEKLSDVGSHLKHWRSFTADQKTATLEAFTRQVEKWPTPVLEHIKKAAQLELQKR